MDNELIICRCEEITKAEIIASINEGYTTINDIRKRTRAGMGFCQGKTCESLVRQIIVRHTGQEPKDILPSTSRPPVRPVPIAAFAKGSDEYDFKFGE